jgi:hypothetical protein
LTKIVSALTIRKNQIGENGMWQKSHVLTVKDVEPEQVWRIWSDISRRIEWDDDTEWAKIDGPFKKGAVFYMKPKGGPKLKMTISECIPNQLFTDTYRFPLARMDGIHHMEKTSSGLRITTTIKISGPLAWLWRKLVAEKVAKTLPHQTQMLVDLARKMGRS